MHYPNLLALTTEGIKRMTKGPLALVMVEDTVEVDSTLSHLDALGFAHLVVFCAPDTPITASPAGLVRVDYDTLAENALQQAVNAMIAALPECWLYYCYNAEYLFYPFCETRSVPEMLAFVSEERRSSVMSYVIDLYAADLTAHPDGVDRKTAHFDASGYYALALTEPDGTARERQLEIAGGLRWRFEEHIPQTRRRTDRVSFFQATAGLTMLPDKSFSIPEYNTYACPWHNSLTAAVPSFRTAKALRRNPGSRHAINSFHWPQSQRFDWTSAQLLDLGMMEPGQWF